VLAALGGLATEEGLVLRVGEVAGRAGPGRVQQQALVVLGLGEYRGPGGEEGVGGGDGGVDGLW